MVYRGDEVYEGVSRDAELLKAGAYASMNPPDFCPGLRCGITIGADRRRLIGRDEGVD